MPGDNHQQHADRHDDDVAVLQHEVGQVDRLQEDPACRDLEERHDRDQREKDAVLTQMAAQEAPAAFRRGGGMGGCGACGIGHARSPDLMMLAMIRS